MNQYRIIGGDGKEYGPISADQMRQWLAEGRVNAQTRILVEGATEWKTLGELPEFGAAPPTPPLTPPLGAAAPAFAPVPTPAGIAGMVQGPATGLLITAVIGFLAAIAAIIWTVGFAGAFAAQQGQLPWGNLIMSSSWTFVSSGVGIAMSVLIFVAALKMKKLENHGLAMTASIIAMLPCVSPCCLVGLPIGIWALVVLSKPEVKSAFH
jgi:hypothetical protein